jgi:hypothetical protein
MSSLGQILSSRANRRRSLYSHDFLEQRKLPNGPTPVSEHPPLPAPGEYSDWLRSAAADPLRNPTLLQPPANALALFPLPAGPQPLITRWSITDWLRFAISARRRSPAPSALWPRPVLILSTPRPSYSSLLIQLKLTRNWLRSVNSWLPPPQTVRLVPARIYSMKKRLPNVRSGRMP